MSKEIEALWENMQSRIASNISTIEYTTIKQALNRLEAIDNSNPSEALKELKRIDWNITYLLNACDINEEVDMNFTSIKEHKSCEIIKQALLKAQQPKKYLKWEDLKFTRDEKVMTVKMGDTVYKVLYRCCDSIEEVQLLSEDEKLLCLNLIGKYKDNIQLFNDLRLERVEE